MAGLAMKADSPVSLEAVWSTDELKLRPSRLPDHKTEKHALLANRDRLILDLPGKRATTRVPLRRQELTSGIPAAVFL
jgi:hypothetical protein